MKVTGKFTFIKRTRGKIVQTVVSKNMLLANGAGYMMNHFFPDTSNVTTFYLGLIRSTGGVLEIRYADSATVRLWREENVALLGNRQIWIPSLVDFPPEVNNRSSIAIWTLADLPGSVFIRGAFLTHDDAIPYVDPPSSNTGKNPPFAASFATSVLELNKFDTLSVEYSLSFA